MIRCTCKWYVMQCDGKHDPQFMCICHQENSTEGSLPAKTETSRRLSPSLTRIVHVLSRAHCEWYTFELWPQIICSAVGKQCFWIELMTICSEGPLWPGRCQGTYLGAHRSELPEGRWHVRHLRSLSCALKTGTNRCLGYFQMHIWYINVYKCTCFSIQRHLWLLAVAVLQDSTQGKIMCRETQLRRSHKVLCLWSRWLERSLARKDCLWCLFHDSLDHEFTLCFGENVEPMLKRTFPMCCLRSGWPSWSWQDVCGQERRPCAGSEAASSDSV